MLARDTGTVYQYRYIGDGLPGDYYIKLRRNKYQLRRRNRTVADRRIVNTKDHTYVLYLDINVPVYKCLGYVFNGAALKQSKYGVAFIPVQAS